MLRKAGAGDGLANEQPRRASSPQLRPAIASLALDKSVVAPTSMGCPEACEASSLDVSSGLERIDQSALHRRSDSSISNSSQSRGTRPNFNNGQLASPNKLRRENDELFDAGPCSPPPFTSPSVASSLAFPSPGFSASPFRRELSQTTAPNDIDAATPTSRAARHILASRLNQLARRLTYDVPDGVDDTALNSQLEQLERVVRDASSPEPRHGRRELLTEGASRSDVASPAVSPISSLPRSRFSDLSASLHREREANKKLEDKPLPAPTLEKGMTSTQAKKVITEMSKLNDELAAVVSNLKARQEESEHIQDLLIERAERAAERIIFLHNRVGYLERELADNDDELQHLRICLKAVEIQMPPHPDKELQRCLSAFKEAYQEARHQRDQRTGTASITGFDSPVATSRTP